MSPNLTGQCAGIPHRSLPFAGSLHREQLPWESPRGAACDPGGAGRDSPVLGLGRAPASPDAGMCCNFSLLMSLPVCPAHPVRLGIGSSGW